MKRIKTIFFACIINSAFVNGQSAIEINHAKELFTIGSQINIFIDKTHSLSIKEILQQGNQMKFNPGEQIIPNIGVTDAALWCKFQIINTTNEDCYLEISNPALDSISLFEIISNNSFAEKKSGAYLNMNQREIKSNNYLFRLCGKTDKAKFFYLRVRHSRGTQFQMHVGTLAGFAEYHHTTDLIHGIYFGLMIVMIFYNLFVYFSVRDYSYLFYVLYVACMTLMNAFIAGYAFEYFWPGNAWINSYEDIVSGLLGIFGILFAKNFLHTKQNVPVIHKILNLFLVLLTTGIITVFAGKFMLGTITIEIISLALIIVFFIAAIKSLIKGYKPAKFFLIAWSVLLAGVIIFILKDFNLVPCNTFTVYSLQFGSGFEAVLLSFALANRINIYKKEKEEAQLQSLNSLKENEKLILTQNIMLESKVEERTHDLNESLQELKKTQLQLVQHEKMALLGQLSAGIAHEIQNPLNFVNNFSSMSDELIQEMEESKSEEDKQAALAQLKIYQAKISQHGRRAENIVKNMLEHSRTGTGEKRQVNINKLCDEYFNLTYNGIRANNPDFSCILNKDFAENLPEVKVIPQTLSRVFINLFNNAFYSVKEKSKRKDIVNSGYKPTVTVSTFLSDQSINIKIKDNGNGIPVSIKNKIFEPFFTTKPVGQGTGLGLSLSYDIIQAHGGEISVESEEGNGATFSISIRLSAI